MSACGSGQRLDLRRRQLTQAFGGGRARAGAAARRNREGDANRLGGGLCGQRKDRAEAFAEPALEQAGGERRNHVDAGVERARRLAANGDVVLVAAELGDVALHPFQHGLLVENAVIGEEMAFVVQGRMREKAHEVQAVFHRDDDGLAVRGHLAAVIAGGLAVDIAAAVDPDDHGKLG